MRKKKMMGVLAIVTAAVLCTGCTSGLSTGTGNTSKDGAVTTAADADAESGVADEEGIAITLADDNSSCASEGVTIEGNVITITAAGTYILSGTLSDGRIEVNTDKESDVELVLNGVDITCSDYAAIVVRQAGNVDIKLAKDSVNKVEDGKEYTFVDTDDSTDACIFSKDDLDFKGSGTLYVTGNYKHGIVCKDDLEFKKGTYIITAVEDGVNANDSITIESGTYTIAAGDDGMHVDELFTIEDCDLTITECNEGLEGHQIIINGGTIDITSADDGINANCGPDSEETTGTGDTGGNFVGAMDEEKANGENTDGDATAGAMTPPSDMGEMSNMTPPSDMGDMSNMTPPGDMGERPSSMQGGVQGGMQGGMQSGMGGGMQGTSGVTSNASADGTNTQGMGGGMQGGMGGGMVGETDEDSLLQINGGTIVINASGDALDANGYIKITGGEAYVSGAANNGNGALDSGLGMEISGGTIIAVGYSGMAECFGQDSTQIFYRYNSNTTHETGETITVTDASGNTLLSYVAPKSYNSVIVSTGEFASGQSYTLQMGSETVTLE